MPAFVNESSKAAGSSWANAEDLPAHGEAVTARFERRDEAEAGTENAPA